MAGLLKKTTGLVGLAVCDTPHERLKILYAKILDVLDQIPKNAAYRKYTEQITNEKLSMVKAEPNVKKLEEQLQSGQIEEVIVQAENELSLARKMVQWKPWEPLVDEPPTNQWKWPI
ncbi:NADH dehydrogenase [ubiquinone] 1 alpha subcomplex subunit 5 isoform X1 [Erinaceus europaeus]|uniref:NADH dehydrogenase [ubiquinone] 1 alpha subcomplex subunit 5 n=1 Tax=Erinaceus europaeus TaxID=9365 RepID=A0A1S3A9Z8_ERIEU|nr:NADH dehydrogenase [ubiquinone] 1 alpha subcomplex subunit 5 isoform X1 [Erinaceus europaeus]